MADGDIVQSNGDTTGADLVSTLTVSLDAAISSGNSALLVLMTDAQPRTPSGWALTGYDAQVLFYTAPAGGLAGESSWDVSWASGTHSVAWYLIEFEGVFTAGTKAVANSGVTAQSTLEVGPVTSDSGDILVAMLCDYQAAGTDVGVPSGWSGGFTAVGNSGATSQTGDDVYNGLAAVATLVSDGSDTSTTVTVDSDSYLSLTLIPLAFGSVDITFADETLDTSTGADLATWEETFTLSTEQTDSGDSTIAPDTGRAFGGADLSAEFTRKAADLRLELEGSPGGEVTGDARWYEFAVWLDPDGAWDTSSVVLAQGVSTSATDIGLPWQFTIQDGEFHLWDYIDQGASSVPMSGPSQHDATNLVWSSSDVPTGRWLYFVLKVVYATDLSGSMQLSLNGTVVANRSGLRTLHSDADQGMYPKFGIYGNPAASVDQSVWFGRYGSTDTAPDALGATTPVCSAGSDRTDVVAGQTATVTGTDSDTGGTIVTRVWRQISGPTVTLTGTGQSRSYTAPDTSATLVFGYQVWDDYGRSATEDTVTHTVLPPDVTTPDLDYATLTGDLIKLVADTTNDADAWPDALALNGSMTLTPGTPYLVSTDSKQIVFLDPIPAQIVNGRVVDAEGNGSIKIVASDTGGVMLDSPFTWTASFKLDKAHKYGPITFKILSGESKDLSELTPVPVASRTSLVVQGQSAYEVAVANGFDGTVTEWLDSLKGESALSVTDNGDGTFTIGGSRVADNGDGTFTVKGSS